MSDFDTALRNKRRSSVSAESSAGLVRVLCTAERHAVHNTQGRTRLSSTLFSAIMCYRQIYTQTTNEIPMQPIHSTSPTARDVLPTLPTTWSFPRGNSSHAAVSQQPRRLFSFSGRNASPHRRSVARLVLHLICPVLIVCCIVSLTCHISAE